MVKKRADILLVQQGLFHSRTQAQRAIMAGLVSDHNHQRIDKSGTSFPVDEIFYIKKMIRSMSLVEVLSLPKP